MKKLIATLGLALCALTATAEEEPQRALFINLNDGTSVAYVLADLPEVSFAGSDMTVATNSASVSYAMASVESWTFGPQQQTSVGQLQAGRPIVNVSDSFIEVSLTAPAQICVYDTAGRLVASTLSDHASFALGKGIYIITAGSMSVKVAK